MNESPHSLRGRSILLVEGILLGLILMVGFLIWQRNRDILCDMYDYSSVIVAAGKIEAGLKPYVDFRSTMQTAGYVLSRGVEKVFGTNYLSLTKGGLLLIIGGGLLLHFLWRKQFSPWLALMLAGAVSLGGLAQHVVIFYNPVGLLCLAVVVAGMPVICREKSEWNWRWVAVFSALVLSGANKINFHGLAMGLAGLIVLVAAVQKAISWRCLAVWWLALLVVGLLLPWGLELLWTGASPTDWFNNVVVLAEERVGFVGRVFSLQTYAGPTYDYHHYILIKPLHTIGLVVIAGVVIVAWRVSSAWSDKLVILALAIAGALGGVLLTVTNVESIALTSQGTLLGAIAVAANLPEAQRRKLRVWLGLAAALWMTVGGYAAWQGSRVLYGQNDVQRETYIRLEHAPKSLQYLEGVRLEPKRYSSLLLVAEDLAKIEQRDGNLSKVWFGPTLEWLERGHPESIMPGMPVWYHVGTALKQSDGPWLIKSMWAKGITNFYLQPQWEGWPAEFQAYLNEFTLQHPVGVLRKYVARSKPFTAYPTLNAFHRRRDVMAFFNRTGSNLHLRTTQSIADIPPTFRSSQWGDYYAAAGSWSWRWDRGGRRVEGVFVATTEDRVWTDASIKINWQVIADPEGAREIIWQGESVTLDRNQRDARVAFQFEANERPVELMVTVVGDHPESVLTGWRGIRVQHAGRTKESSPPPGMRSPLDASEVVSAQGRISWKRWTDTLDQESAGLNDWTVHPFEIWSLAPGEAGPVSASLEIAAQPGSTGVVPIFMLMWYKAGRLEMLRQISAPSPNGIFEISGRSPEPGGWMGLVVRPANPDTPMNSKFRFRSWMGTGPK